MLAVGKEARSAEPSAGVLYPRRLNPWLRIAEFLQYWDEARLTRF